MQLTLSTEQDEQMRWKLVKDYFLRFRATFGPGTGVVMKCPGYSKYFPQLAKLISNGQFVLIIRDTLDIVASQIEVGERQSAGMEK